MDGIYTFVDNLDTNTTEWNIKVRAVRVWNTPYFKYPTKTFSLDAVFVDRRGGRIHASAKGHLIGVFSPLLHEGGLYAIRHFLVERNNLKYKVSSCKNKIEFISMTKIVAVDDVTFPKEIYKFRSFHEIIESEKPDESELFDVIGEVVGKGDVLHKDIRGKASKLIDVHLEDLEKNKLSCTLWDNYVDDVVSYFNSDNREPVIILLQMCHATTYNGVKISNCYYVTKLLINAHLDEIESFRNKLLVGRDATCSRISHISSSKVYSVNNDFSGGSIEYITITELCNSKEVGSFCVRAKIVSIDNALDWCYLSCHKCYKKPNTIESGFYCVSCDLRDSSGNYRYKLQVRVIDDTGNTSFLLWDKECIQLLGRTAIELREEMLEKPPPMGYPIDIENVVGKTLLFRVQVRENNLNGRSSVYSVVKLTEDLSLMPKHLTKVMVDCKSNHVVENCGIVDSNSKLSSDDEVNSPIKTPSIRVDKGKQIDPGSTRRALDADFSSHQSSNKLRKIIKEEKE